MSAPRRIGAALAATVFAPSLAVGDVFTLRISTLASPTGARIEIASDKPAPPAPPPRPTFRHTFGSERRESEPKAGVAIRRPVSSADLYLLSGVVSAPMTRRVFPVSDWNLVLSRQLALPVQERGNAEQGVTGIAIKVSENTRIMRLEHVATDLGRPLPAETAATAALVKISGRLLWIVAVDLSGACHLDPPDVHRCRHAAAARARLAGWLAERVQENVPIVIGGPNADAILPDVPSEKRPSLTLPLTDKPAPDRPGTAELSIESESATNLALAHAERRIACDRGLRSHPQIVIVDRAGVSAPLPRGWLVPVDPEGSDASSGCALVMDLALFDQ